MPKLEKGSQEAKQRMALARAGFMKKRATTIREQTGIESIDVPIMNKVQLDIPPVFAYESNGELKLANPTTKGRNLARRNQNLSVVVKRKPIEKPEIYAETVNIKPEDLSAQQLMILLKYASDIEANRGISSQNLEAYPNDPVVERGRPEKLQKNIDINREKKRQAKEKKATAPAQAPAPATKRAYVKRDTEESKREAILEQKRQWAKKNYQKKKATGGKIHSLFTDPINTLSAAYYGRDDYAPKDRELLKKYGDERIKSLVIKRSPVTSAITGAINAISMGKFNRRLAKKDYDTLFHLFLEIITETGRKFLIEKNEAINFEKSPADRKDTEQFVVSNVPDITINDMLNNTRKSMGKAYFKYDATKNNCQDFILGIFKANGFGTEQEKAFIKQDTESLFKNLDKTSKIAKVTTDLGGFFNVITKGKGCVIVNTYKNQ